METQANFSTDKKSNMKYLKMCEIAGLRHPGQRARVLSPKYWNHEAEILAINWSDGEVLMKRPISGNYPMLNGERWWPISMIQILDPDYGPMPELSQGRSPSAHSPSDPAVTHPKIAQVTQDVSNLREPEIAPEIPQLKKALSWIPKRIT